MFKYKKDTYTNLNCKKQIVKFLNTDTLAISIQLFNKADRNNPEQVALGELDPSISILIINNFQSHFSRKYNVYRD